MPAKHQSRPSDEGVFKALLWIMLVLLILVFAREYMRVNQPPRNAPSPARSR